MNHQEGGREYDNHEFEARLEVISIVLKERVKGWTKADSEAVLLYSLMRMKRGKRPQNVTVPEGTLGYEQQVKNREIAYGFQLKDILNVHGYNDVRVSVSGEDRNVFFGPVIRVFHSESFLPGSVTRGILLMSEDGQPVAIAGNPDGMNHEVIHGLNQIVMGVEELSTRKVQTSEIVKAFQGDEHAKSEFIRLLRAMILDEVAASAGTEESNDIFERTLQEQIQRQAFDAHHKGYYQYYTKIVSGIPASIQGLLWDEYRQILKEALQVLSLARKINSNTLITFGDIVAAVIAKNFESTTRILEVFDEVVEFRDELSRRIEMEDAEESDPLYDFVGQILVK